jgi:hypothetical protein
MKKKSYATFNMSSYDTSRPKFKASPVADNRTRANWERDDARSSCAVCNIRFSVFFCRRHHCRNCGKLVCGSCAPWKPKKRMQRVCSLCKDGVEMMMTSPEMTKTRKAKRTSSSTRRLRSVTPPPPTTTTSSSSSCKNLHLLDMHEKESRIKHKETMRRLKRVTESFHERSKTPPPPPRPPVMPRNLLDDIELSSNTTTVSRFRSSTRAADVFSQQRLARWEYRRRRQMERKNRTTSQSRHSSSGVFDSFSLSQDWEIDAEELEFKNKIAAGGTSTVWLAEYEGNPVAVKEPYEQRADGGISLEFAREAEVLVQLSHPYVLKFLGLCYRSGAACLVIEWCPKDLLHWLKTHDCRSNERHRDEAMRIVFQVSQGIAYMHRQGIAHMDLKPSNVLLTSAGVPKVADFGLSVLLRKGSDELSEKIGSPVYMPPEFLSRKKKKRRTSFRSSHFARDVYSFAMLVWAVFASVEPFPECRFGHEVVEMVVQRDMRPDLDIIPVALHGILIEAWHKNPKVRPDFETLSLTFGKLSGFLGE